MTVIAKRLGLIRVRRRGQYSVPQHILVDEGNTKHRFENASLVSSLPMPRIQHIVFDLRAENRRGLRWVVSSCIGLPESVTKCQAAESRIMRLVETGWPTATGV